MACADRNRGLASAGAYIPATLRQLVRDLDLEALVDAVEEEAHHASANVIAGKTLIVSLMPCSARSVCATLGT